MEVWQDRLPFPGTNGSAPPVPDSTISGGQLILGDGTTDIQIMANFGRDVTLLDPTLFTDAVDGATGVSIGNVPVGSTLEMDNDCFAGNDLVFAGAPGFLPGTLTLFL
jgi:hypothetical protein